jgi:hypothetical protein
MAPNCWRSRAVGKSGAKLQRFPEVGDRARFVAEPHFCLAAIVPGTDVRRIVCTRRFGWSRICVGGFTGLNERPEIGYSKV